MQRLVYWQLAALERLFANMTSLQTSNIFAALGDVKGGKKKSSKSKGEGGEKKKKQSKAEEKSQLEAAIFSGLPSVSNWADELDEEDDFGGGLGALPDGWSAVSLVTFQPLLEQVYSQFGVQAKLQLSIAWLWSQIGRLSPGMHCRQCLASSSRLASVNALRKHFRNSCVCHHRVRSC